MQDSILRYLKTLTAVTSLLGSDPLKVFFGDCPAYVKDTQGERIKILAPYVLLQSAGGPTVKHMLGRCDVRERNYQISVVSNHSVAQAEPIYEAMRDALGDAGYDLWDDLFVHYSNIDEPEDVSLPPTAGSDRSEYILAGRLFVRFESPA